MLITTLEFAFFFFLRETTTRVNCELPTALLSFTLNFLGETVLMSHVQPTHLRIVSKSVSLVFWL